MLDFQVICSVPPAFAANTGTCCEGGVNDGAPCVDDGGCPGGACTSGACVSGAAEGADSAIVHDVFGPRLRPRRRRNGERELSVMRED